MPDEFINTPEFLADLREGNEISYQKLINSLQGIVLNTCFRIVQDKETSEDLTQEVFIEVFRSVKKFRGESKLSTWIYRISVTKSIDFIRKKNRKKRFAQMVSIFNNDEILPRSVNRQDNPDQKLQDDDRKRVLELAMDKLSENQRVALQLSKYDEFSYTEIAEIMNTSISAVESLLHRAKNNLKKYLYKMYKENLI